jgi:hypothetical protein
MIFQFESHNDCDGFLIWASKPRRIRFVGCATKPTEGGQCDETHVDIWRLALPGSKSR